MNVSRIKFFWLSVLISFCWFGTLGAQATTDPAIDLALFPKTCTDFCTEPGTDSVNESCLKACNGCMNRQKENYPQLEQAVCSGSTAVWLDENNTSVATWNKDYKSCDKPDGRKFLYQDASTGEDKILSKNVVSDLYKLRRGGNGDWQVESLNPWCYNDPSLPLEDFRANNDELLWWERIDGPLRFASSQVYRPLNPLLTICTTPVTSDWIKKLLKDKDEVGFMTNKNLIDACFDATAYTANTTNPAIVKNWGLVAVCPEPKSGDSIYPPHAVTACSRKLSEIKLNCNCQQEGLNAWLDEYEGQGSYLTDLKDAYRLFGQNFFYEEQEIKDGDGKTKKQNTPLLVFGKVKAEDAAKMALIKTKTKTVSLKEHLDFTTYKDASARLITTLEKDFGPAGTVNKKTVQQLIVDAALDTELYETVMGQVRQIALAENIMADAGYKQMIRDIESTMKLLALPTNKQVLHQAQKINGLLAKWDTRIRKSADGTQPPSPKNPLKGTTTDSTWLAVDPAATEADKVVTVGAGFDFSKFNAQYMTLESVHTNIVRKPGKSELNQAEHLDYKMTQQLKQNKQALQQKIWLLDARMGSFAKEQQVKSTTSYPVSKVLQTKYATSRPNGDGGTTYVPGSTEGEMQLLKHEADQAVCREAFSNLNKLKKEGAPSDNNFQKYQNEIRRLEADYKLRCGNNFIDKVIKTVAQILGTAAILLIIIGSYVLVTAQGDESQISQGKNYFQYAAIGLAISFLSYTIVQFIIDAILW